MEIITTYDTKLYAEKKKLLIRVFSQDFDIIISSAYMYMHNEAAFRRSDLSCLWPVITCVGNTALARLKDVSDMFYEMLFYSVS